MGDMIGKSDPYVKIKFGDQEFKSRKVRNTLEPEWNFSANLIVSSSDENSDIVVEVYDDDFGKENFIGSYKFSLKHAIKETDKPAVWCNLVGCKSGKIFFSTIYSPDEEPATKSDSKEEKLIAEEENKEQTIKSFAQDQNKNDKEPQEKEVTPKTDIKNDRDEKEKEISTEKDQSESASDDSSESSKSSEEKEDVVKEEKELVKLKSQEKEAVNERKETEVKSSETNEEKQITATKKEAKNEKSSDEIVAAGLDELDVNEIEENLLSEKEKEDKDPEKKAEERIANTEGTDGKEKPKAKEDSELDDLKGDEKLVILEIKSEGQKQDIKPVIQSPAIEKIPNIPGSKEAVSDESNKTSKENISSKENKREKETIPDKKEDQSLDRKEASSQQPISTEKDSLESEKNKIISAVEKDTTIEDKSQEIKKEREESIERKQSLKSETIGEPEKKEEKENCYDVEKSKETVKESQKKKDSITEDNVKDDKSTSDSKLSQDEDGKAEKKDDKSFKEQPSMKEKSDKKEEEGNIQSAEVEKNDSQDDIASSNQGKLIEEDEIEQSSQPTSKIKTLEDEKNKDTNQEETKYEKKEQTLDNQEISKQDQLIVDKKDDSQSSEDEKSLNDKKILKTEKKEEQATDEKGSSFETFEDEKKDKPADGKKLKVTKNLNVEKESIEIVEQISNDKKETVEVDITKQPLVEEEFIVQEAKVIETSSQKEEANFRPGNLEITVHRASELVNNDKAGKSDPYVKIRYIDEEFRSKTINNTLEPEWNFSCEFDILNLKDKYIHINVYDDDFGKDNIEGCYSLYINEAIFELVGKGKWYNLVGCKTGKVYISTKYTPVKMEDTSTEKPVHKIPSKDISEDIEADNFEKAEKIVGDIVQKAEKVIGEVQAKLNETESNVSKTLLSSENDVNVTKEQIKKISVDKDDEFIEISKESEVIIQKMEKTFVESQTVIESSVKQDIVHHIEKKEESLTLQNGAKADSFQEIEKESKEIVSKLEKSFVSTDEVKDKKGDDEVIAIKPGFLKVIVFEASELVNKYMLGKSDPYVKINFRDQEFKSRKVSNTLEPEWNFSANLMVTSSDENSDILLEVYDDDYGKEDFIGSYTFSLEKTIKETDKEAVWYNLVGCKSGKISVSTIYSPDEEPATKPIKEKQGDQTSIQKDSTDITDECSTQDSFIKDIKESDGKQEVKNSSKEKDESEEKIKEENVEDAFTSDINKSKEDIAPESEKEQGQTR